MPMVDLFRVLFLLPLVAAYYHGGHIYGNNFGIPGRNQSYDFVIVGGGTAGLALAARLAENTSHTVAVIEAGGFYEIDNGNISSVPLLGVGAFNNPLPQSAGTSPNVDWGLLTTNQTGLLGQQYHYWRGRTLGGRYGKAFRKVGD
jgi:choline dehydrogenase